MSNSFITLLIIAITVITSYQAFNSAGLFNKLKYSPYRVKQFKEYYRVFSHVLVHADWTHLLFNMYTFYSFGVFMEKVFVSPLTREAFFPAWGFGGVQLGIVLYLALYLIGGIVAAIPAYKKHSDNVFYASVGASGAVSAILMAFMLMFPDMQVAFFFLIPMPSWVGVLIFFGLEHYLQRRGGTNIAHDAHIFGALAGISFVTLLNPNIPVKFIKVVLSTFIG